MGRLKRVEKGELVRSGLWPCEFWFVSNLMLDILYMNQAVTRSSPSPQREVRHELLVRQLRIGDRFGLLGPEPVGSALPLVRTYVWPVAVKTKI